ncbi:MAG: STAS domain-containing protein, partial [Acidithiobacillus sp.]
MSTATSWERRMVDGAPWLFLQGDWRVAPMDRVLRSFAWAKDGQDCTEVSVVELEAADSATLAVLMEWVQQARQRGTALRIHGASSKLQELASLYRLQDIL